MTSSMPASHLDFETLLSRDYRPANLARVIPRDALTRASKAKQSKTNDDGDSDDDEEDDNEGNKARSGSTKKNILSLTKRSSEKTESTKQRSDEETVKLVLQLVTKTPIHKLHAIEDDAAEENRERERGFLKQHSMGLSFIADSAQRKDATAIPSKFHQIELGDWEHQIHWDGYTGGKSAVNTSRNDRFNDVEATINTDSASAFVGRSVSPNNFEPADLLRKKRNPFLDDLSTTLDTMISWSGSKEDAMQKIKKQPLILELGVAGRSVAKQLLPSHRPVPAIKSDAYQQRVQADWKPDAAPITEFNRGTLQKDKEKMARLIAQRQEKRRQMAKDKTNRVTEAMGKLQALGSGRGRTITSSLMGPGGTERTGRPSRHVGNEIHDMEYIEQLDMTTNHVLFRDLSKVSLRQYHRPKLPLAVVRTSLVWQFQVRYLPSSAKSKNTTPGQGGDNTSSYQTMMMGTHPGAVSKAKLRAESDLSPTEGNLILLEYCEERPPLQITKGMGSKIVTYYRGDKARCPVSAGGGDRPMRRKRPGAEAQTSKKESAAQSRLEGLPKLVGPDHALTSTSMKDWVGRMPKKTREDRNENAGIHVLPEGVTEILHPKVHGPFIGEIDHGQAVTGLISNLFVAPLFHHEPEHTDFLMILGRNAGVSVAGRHESLGVVLRDLPKNMYAVGQTEPRSRVYAPNTQGEKNFFGPFVSYQIAKALSRAESREGHGLRFDEIQSSVLPNLGLQTNNIRQRLKLVALYDKNTQIWTTKSIGFEDYPGVEALGKQIPPEGVAAFEVASAAVRRLNDLGIHQLFAGSHAVTSVGVAMIYLAGQVNAAKEHARKFKKLCDAGRSNKNIQNLQLTLYEKAAEDLDNHAKLLRQKQEVAKFIYEELQLAPWHLTGEFIDVHKKGEGTGMMRLTGIGDPSGIGDGFSFIREADAKPSKSMGAAAIAQSAQLKKITGTEDDLRKLTMKQMARILQSYGMAQKQIATLKRWDRVHVIRDLSTKNASDGMSDGLERFARGEKMKLSEQKQMYRDRIKVIWKRQIAALSMVEQSDGRALGTDGVGASGEGDDAIAEKSAQKKKEEVAKEESDSESEDDDFAAEMEEEMMDKAETTQLVLAQTNTGGNASIGQLRNATQDQDLTKDARELAALKRQREEERAAKEGMASLKTGDESMKMKASYANRKVIRRKVTKTFPDGRQITTFKFVVHPEEVGKIMARIQQDKDKKPMQKKERPEYQADDKLVGHSMFEDEDDFKYTTRGRQDAAKRRGGNRRVRTGAKTSSRKNEFQFGKLKHKVSKEQRMKKRRREEEEAELYTMSAKRKGTSNRKERGSIRERKPHVIMADRLEAIRGMIEARPSGGPFVKPVNRRAVPRYHEVISNPIDLSTIRDKVQKYEYRTVDAFLKDFALMKANAIKFNGTGSLIAEEGAAIYQVVKDKVEKSRAEFSQLEVAVEEQMNGKPKKNKKSELNAGAGAATGIGVNNVPGDFNFLESDSDDD